MKARLFEDDRNEVVAFLEYARDEDREEMTVIHIIVYPKCSSVANYDLSLRHYGENQEAAAEARLQELTLPDIIEILAGRIQDGLQGLQDESP